MRKVQVAALQCALGGNREENVGRIESLVAEAAAGGPCPAQAPASPRPRWGSAGGDALE